MACRHEVFHGYNTVALTENWFKLLCAIKKRGEGLTKKGWTIIFKLFELFYDLITFKPDGESASQQIPLYLLIGEKKNAHLEHQFLTDYGSIGWG